MALLDIVSTTDECIFFNRGTTSIINIVTETDSIGKLNRGNTGTILNSSIIQKPYVGITNVMPSQQNVFNKVSYGRSGTEFVGQLIVPGMSSGYLTMVSNTSAGRSGTYCVQFTPTSTTNYGYWHFYIATSSLNAQITFWHKISSGFNGSLKTYIYGPNNNLVIQETVTLTNDNTYHQYTSTPANANSAGLCLVQLEFLQGTNNITDSIYIDDLTSVV